ncbi:hypothetical protein U0070_021558, partial [Myodes glareolus]
RAERCISGSVVSPTGLWESWLVSTRPGGPTALSSQNSHLLGPNPPAASHACVYGLHWSEVNSQVGHHELEVRAVGPLTGLEGGQKETTQKALRVLEHVPLLLYILAAKTLILCLAFAGVKMYQRKSLEAKLQAERKQRSEKKEN